MTTRSTHQNRRDANIHLSGKAAAGFSLLALVIVSAIICVVAGLSLASFANRNQAGTFTADVAARIRERRASAMRINALTEATLIENFKQAPISIDFSDLPSTAPLVTEGTTKTTFNPPSPGATGSWTFVYQGEPLSTPSGWRIA